MKNTKKLGFSLVEVLAAVSIIGIIAFIAIPNIVAIKKDAERNLAIARAEALNMAVASYIQSNGRDLVAPTWTTKNNDQRYTVLIPYLSFAPNAIATFTPAGYSTVLPTNLNALTKAILTDTGLSPNVVIVY